MTDTAIYMILDGSGSMSGTKNDVVDGVNEFIKEQQEETKKLGATTLLSLTSFDSRVNEVYVQEDISLVNPVTVADTYLGGGTALLDAIGRTLTKAEDNTASRNLVVIYTDGHENQSSEFTSDDIKKLMDKFDKAGNWQFIYLGAEFGDFSKDQAYQAATWSVNSNSMNTSKGNTKQVFRNVSHTHSAVRTADVHEYAGMAGPNGLMGATGPKGMVADWAAVEAPTNALPPDPVEIREPKKKVKNVGRK